MIKTEPNASAQHDVTVSSWHVTMTMIDEFPHVCVIVIAQLRFISFDAFAATLTKMQRHLSDTYTLLKVKIMQ